MRTGKVSGLFDKDIEVYEGIQEIIEVQEEKKKEEEKVLEAVRKFAEHKILH